jgi:DNA-binding response OmpR family regulator
MWQETIQKEIAKVPEAKKLQKMQAYIDYLVPRDEPTILLNSLGYRFTKIEGRYIYILSTPLGRVISVEQLLARAHVEAGGCIEYASVASNIKRLRPKLVGTGMKIECHWGLGYSLEASNAVQFPWSMSGMYDREKLAA